MIPATISNLFNFLSAIEMSLCDLCEKRKEKDISDKGCVGQGLRDSRNEWNNEMCVSVHSHFALLGELKL